MIVNNDYIEKIKDIKSDFNLAYKSKSCHYINEIFREKLHEDIIKVDFKTLYSYVEITLFDCGLIDKKWQADIEKMRWFLENKENLKKSNDSKYEEYLIHCNSLYGKIRSSLVCEYMSLYYKNLIEKYNDYIIAINTDTIYFNFHEIEKLREIEELNDFDYSVFKVDYFYIEDQVKYIEQCGEIMIKKFGYTNDEVCNEIKSRIRNKKIDKLLIK